ncbi:MAG: hypothetical protein A2V88_11625 [Elusimicrobia bacterium RBG_16_66_12]|nr:MAG: hypothetical protein A2V88_11625 [Elusimicrobia bacterium RBG_16_66_12]
MLRSHPAEAGVDPQFEVADEANAAFLQQQAVEAALALATQDHDLAPLFASFSPISIADLIAFLLRRRLDVGDLLQGGAAPERARQVIAAALASFLDGEPVHTAIADLRQLQASGGLEGDAGDKLADQVRALLAEFARAGTFLAQGNPIASGAALFTIRREHTRLNIGRKGSQAKDAVRRIRDVYEARLEPWLGGGKTDDAPPDEAVERRFVEDLHRVIAVHGLATQFYRRSLDEKSSLDFDDLEANTVRLLALPEVCQVWRTELAAVLIDEFQDTNERQRAIVEAICGASPGRLFVVGDARQSIYRFRGADVTVFRRTGAEITARGGEAIELGLTFRAHAGLLHILDRLLPPVMGTSDDPDRLYAVPYSPMLSERPHARKGMIDPHLEFVLGMGRTAEDARPRAAAALVDRLLELRERGDICAWDDVALLFRASTGFAAYEDALERAQIPFVTVAGAGVFERPEVRDLLNLLQAVSDHWDDTAMAGLLRSPVIGMTDAGLFQLRTSVEPPMPFWIALQEPLEGLSIDDKLAARRARSLIDSLTPLVDRLPVATLLRRIVDMSEYRAALAASHHRYWRNLDKLLADAHKTELVRVHIFLDYIRTIRDVGAREGEAPVEAEGAVRLMTIHKAKGLEFPVVVLADATRRIRDMPEIAYLGLDVGLAFNPDRQGARPLAYGLARWLDSQQVVAEESRLLYVASTRAQEKLIVSGHLSGSAGAWRAAGWMDQLLEIVGCDVDEVTASPGAWLALDLGGGAQAALRVAAEDAPVRPWPGAGLASEWPSSEETPLYPPLIETLSEQELDEPEEDVRRDWRATGERIRPPAAVVGLMVHRAIEARLFPGDARLPRELESVALVEGLVDRRQREAAVSEASVLLGRLRDHSLWEEISSADERFHEVPYTRSLGERHVESGVIDLLYRRGSAWHLVDFKVDELRDLPALQVAVGKYRRQVERYTQAAATLLGVRALPRLVFLDYQGEVRVEPVG